MVSAHVPLPFSHSASTLFLRKSANRQPSICKLCCLANQFANWNVESANWVGLQMSERVCWSQFADLGSQFANIACIVSVCKLESHVLPVCKLFASLQTGTVCKLGPTYIRWGTELLATCSSAARKLPVARLSFVSLRFYNGPAEAAREPRPCRRRRARTRGRRTPRGHPHPPGALSTWPPSTCCRPFILSPQLLGAIKLKTPRS